MYAGYQKGVVDIYNRIMDFVKEKDKVESRLRGESAEQKVIYYNPFLEDDDE
jgi:hypothetical protein